MTAYYPAICTFPIVRINYKKDRAMYDSLTMFFFVLLFIHLNELHFTVSQCKIMWCLIHLFSAVERCFVNPKTRLLTIRMCQVTFFFCTKNQHK